MSKLIKTLISKTDMVFMEMGTSGIPVNIVKKLASLRNA